MNLIAAVDRNWGIGKNGDLLFRISKDMKHFARMTKGHVIVVGRKTLESFPGGKPLPGRLNIVLTHNKSYDGKGALVLTCKEDLFNYLSSLQDEVWVAGGGNLYKMLLPYCRYAYITEADATAEADTYMPDLNREPGWRLYRKGESMEEKGIRFRFSVYVNEKPLPIRPEGHTDR